LKCHSFFFNFTLLLALRPDFAVAGFGKQADIRAPASPSNLNDACDHEQQRDGCAAWRCG
jgi:hypothetical protein